MPQKRTTPFNKERYDFPCTPDCVDRKPGCHGKCKRYLEARARRDAQNAARFAKHERESYTIDAVKNRQDRRAKQRKTTVQTRF